LNPKVLDVHAKRRTIVAGAVVRVAASGPKTEDGGTQNQGPATSRRARRRGWRDRDYDQGVRSGYDSTLNREAPVVASRSSRHHCQLPHIHGHSGRRDSDRHGGGIRTGNLYRAYGKCPMRKSGRPHVSTGAVADTAAGESL
jgi:hypothetical protein